MQYLEGLPSSALLERKEGSVLPLRSATYMPDEAPAMSKLRKPISFETAFGEYVVDELIGEGGAGRVYGGKDSDGASIAIKVLTGHRASTDKRRRFKNEIAFLARNRHANIVTVTDHGTACSDSVADPFYVMQRYYCNLRDLMQKGVAPADVLQVFGQILDGVEAAHLQGVVHRDLKPENILYDAKTKKLAIGDFGIASFLDDQLVTLVKTSPSQRLANFQYAAPEQRMTGKPVGVPADIYALGLILNEMFTGAVPHGTDYQLIGNVRKESAFLDAIVARMLKQNSAERPSSIQEVKHLLQRHQAEAISLQRLSEIDGTVVRVDEIDEPLAHKPPVLIAADWNNRVLTLTLDRPVTRDWINALHRMGNYSAAMGIGPEMFRFDGNKATVDAESFVVQNVIDDFKRWLPKASQSLHQILTAAAKQKAAQRQEQLRREREAEEQRLRVMQSIKI